MQVFIIGTPLETAMALSKRHLNNQINEARIILDALNGAEEQKIDLTKYLDANVFVKDEISFWSLFAANMMDKWKMVFEWCDKNHFDYRGLIPMGLVIDATGLNIY